MHYLIYPTLVSLTIAILSYIIYQNTNKFFRLGYSRAKKAIKSFYPHLQQKLENKNTDSRIVFAKDEIYSLIAKPKQIANIESELRRMNGELLSFQQEKDSLVHRLMEEKKAKTEVLTTKLNEKLRECEEKKRAYDEKKEKLQDEVLLLEDKIKTNEDVLFDKALKSEENKFAPQIECKSANVLTAMSNWILSFYELLKQDILLFIPIILLATLILVDYYVGTAFIVEQYKGNLFEARGADKIILNIKIYSMAFMVFGVVLLMIEFANKKLFDIYQNAFVQGVKWLLSGLIVSFTFIGVVMYLGATRFFESNIALQSKLEDIGLILIWFGLVFVCSILFNEIKNTQRGYTPLITIIEAALSPFIIVSMLVFSVVWVIELFVRKAISFVDIFLPESRVLERSIKNAKGIVADHEKRISHIEINYESRLEREKENGNKEHNKLEQSYEQRLKELDINFVKKHKALTNSIEELNNQESLFREGSDHAVVNLWGKYIF